MESLQSIKRRIKSVKNIKQITKAMELVAATRMRKSQEVALASRNYAFAALDLLASLTRLEEGHPLPPLLQGRPVARRAIVLMASDKGLAGAFNSAVIRDFEKFTKEKGIDLEDPNVTFVAVGQKAVGYLERRTSRLAHSFTRVGDLVTLEEVKPIADLMLKGYLDGSWDEVTVFSTHFRSALVQEVLRRQVLPVDLSTLRATAKEIIPAHGRYSNLSPIEDAHDLTLDYLIEPAPEAIIESLAEHLLLTQIYHLVLEANASEHAARRVAMKSASDNAEELGGKLSLEYNKSRQAAITREIIEIVAGAGSLQ
jgi:F-type H+-transporting ATPase subunit gamma